MNRNHIPSLDDLRAFEIVARLGSVRAAAKEIALTHGAVSRRIIKLAQEIDVTLFERKGRGIRLTVEGEKLAKATTEALALLSTTLTDIKIPHKMSPITLSCERSVALHWLIPRLSVFQDANPTIELHLSVGGGTFDFTTDSISLAIRRMDFPINPDWIVEPLMQESMGPVMQPSMVSRFQEGDFVALASTTRPDAWEKWRAGHKSTPAPSKTLFLDHHFLIVEGAINGLGVAMCPKVLAVDALKQGRLVAPYGFSSDNTNYALIHTNKSTEDDQFNLVKDWI
ncbi:MAG: LysR family transcriptional regulator, partial [Sneathiella sp.]